MRDRLLQILLLASLMWLSWLLMMLVHETGHLIGAKLTGGTVQRVIWHPLVISRTDVHPNPHRVIEVWAGAVLGSAIPLAIAALVSLSRLRVAYLLWFVAGFCLIANGAYIGVGAFDPVGDAEELVSLGVSRWVLLGFGVVAFGAGLWIWHRGGERLGFGRDRKAVVASHAWGVFVACVLVTLFGMLFGNRGS